MFGVHSCIKDFNISVENFEKLKTVSTENNLMRSLTLIDQSKDPIILTPDSIENCKFYINLHSLINTLDPKSDLFWMCISLLENAVKNLEIRDEIVNRFRYLPLFSRILMKCESPEKQERLLKLLEEISYGIKIEQQEFYLDDLLEILTKIIYDNDRLLGSLALTVLINLCYKNVPVIFLLLQTIHISTFTKSILSYGILGQKIQIIIDNYIGTPNVTYLHGFIKQCFIEIDECLNSWNVPRLQQIIGFLIDTINCGSMDMAMKEYTCFNEDVNKITDRLNNEKYNFGRDGGGDSVTKNQALCLSLIFELFNHIMNFDLSIAEMAPTIFELAVYWLDSNLVIAKALELIKTILEKAEKYCKDNFTNINNVISKFVSASENGEMDSEQLTSFFKLLLTLLKKSKMSNLVISFIKESYFDKQFSSLLEMKEEELTMKRFTRYDLSKYLYCLMILIEFANVAQEVWLNKVVILFKTNQVQFILAKALFSKSKNLCDIVFELSKTDSFPTSSLSQKILELTPVLENQVKGSENEFSFEQEKLIMFKKLHYYEHYKINKEKERKLDELISHILEAKKNGDINDIATSEMIELFDYKINLENDSMKSIKKRLEDASTEITRLSHEMILRMKELSWYHNKNLNLHLSREKLELNNSDLIKQRDKLKDSLNELTEKYKSLESSSEIFRKKNENLIFKNQELQKEYDMCLRREKANLNEIKRLESVNAELALKNENIKKMIKVSEDRNYEYKKKVEDNENELVKLKKKVAELQDKNEISENIIKKVQAQLAEKNERLKQCEEELLETEELRNTILTLMKPKRKNHQQSS